MSWKGGCDGPIESKANAIFALPWEYRGKWRSYWTKRHRSMNGGAMRKRMELCLISQCYFHPFMTKRIRKTVISCHAMIMSWCNFAKSFAQFGPCPLLRPALPHEKANSQENRKDGAIQILFIITTVVEICRLGH
jgi:hypothetical protein